MPIIFFKYSKILPNAIVTHLYIITFINVITLVGLPNSNILVAELPSTSSSTSNRRSSRSKFPVNQNNNALKLSNLSKKSNTNVQSQQQDVNDDVIQTFQQIHPLLVSME